MPPQTTVWYITHIHRRLTYTAATWFCLLKIVYVSCRFVSFFDLKFCLFVGTTSYKNERMNVSVSMDVDVRSRTCAESTADREIDIVIINKFCDGHRMNRQLIIKFVVVVVVAVMLTRVKQTHEIYFVALIMSRNKRAKRWWHFSYISLWSLISQRFSLFGFRLPLLPLILLYIFRFEWN